MRFNGIAGIAFAGLCALYATTAMAEDKVAVMKLDSLGSNTDKHAAMVLEALSNEVLKSSSMSLDSSGSDITYTEMQMVTGCDKDASIGCYDAACEALGASAIIFGSIAEGGETKLVWYVSGKGIFREVSGKVIDRATAEKLARDMIVGEVGNLIVTSNVDGAEIYIDGKHVGMSSDNEKNAKPIELLAGNYIVAVRKQGYDREDAVKVVIEPNKKAKVHFDMTVAADPEVFQSAFKIAGWTTLGVGVAALAAGAGLGGAVKSWQDEMDGKTGNGGPIFGNNKSAEDATNLNNKGKKGAVASTVLFGVGGFLAATGAALVCVGYLYDFTGEKADAELLGNGYMPKVDLQVSPEYQGMTLGWTF